MLVPLSEKSEFWSFLNLFSYTSVRTICALFTSFLISVFIGESLIHFLRLKQGKGQPIRKDGPQGHLEKVGTPTMGGLLILMTLTIGTLLWSDITTGYVWAALFITLVFGIIGFTDDYLKVAKQNPDGLPGKLRLTLEFLAAAIATLWIMSLQPDNLSSHISIPSFKNMLIDLGWLFVPFAMIVIVGAGNAVNFTDGLDGLAAVPVAIVAAVFGIISWVVGNAVLSEQLYLYYIPNARELSVFCGALIGASMGFLWFNAPPAKVFMGDTGSLALGGALGAISIITKHELILAIAGGLFVLEAASVIIQVISYKTTGKRVFMMAPIHHHFEKKGWAESTVVIRFWIISIILALIALSTLKIR
ncbi:MAG: phospho-N-acetylmuramoyl-pentapeptide-transferase [Alphaproteobacteria bacterium]